MRYFVTIDGEEHVVEVVELPRGGHAVRLLETADTDPATVEPIVAELSGSGHGCVVHIGGRVFDLVLDGEPPKVSVWASGRRAALEVESARMRAAAGVKSKTHESQDGVVTSPMPGKVVKVLVGEGDEVSAGAPVIVVEAMKMENELTAPRSGVVQKVYVGPGDAVEGGARLLTVV
jgi:glutaconyl-CoA/methylmalonyl-CoA decarboxylase subunit gamma